MGRQEEPLLSSYDFYFRHGCVLSSLLLTVCRQVIGDFGSLVFTL